MSVSKLPFFCKALGWEQGRWLARYIALDEKFNYSLIQSCLGSNSDPTFVALVF